MQKRGYKQHHRINLACAIILLKLDLSIVKLTRVNYVMLKKFQKSLEVLSQINSDISLKTQISFRL